MAKLSAHPPSWDALYEIAAGQSGYFSVAQAADAGFSSPLLTHHLQANRLLRVGRGLYRLSRFPEGEHEDLVVAWLWSGQAGVVSHETVLALHDLSDVLPAKIHLTLPSTCRQRRLNVPRNLLLHYADLPPEDRTWFAGVPSTRIGRTLNDCAEAGLAPDLLLQATRQALRRGLVARDALSAVEAALVPFGGLAA